MVTDSEPQCASQNDLHERIAKLTAQCLLAIFCFFFLIK